MLVVRRFRRVWKQPLADVGSWAENRLCFARQFRRDAWGPLLALAEPTLYVSLTMSDWSSHPP